MTKREKIGILISVGYIAIMAIAMSVMHFVFKFTYTDPNMARVLIFFEVIMTIYAIIVYRKFAKGLMFKRIKVHWAFILIALFEFVAIGVAILTGDFTKQISLLIIIALATLLVGISEEIIFRGILLPIFMERCNVLIALLVNAIVFSLLHSVNVLGGLSFRGVAVQLLMTFFAGVFYGLLALKIKNIIPIMIMHWFWDLILVSQPITKASTSVVMLVALILEFILIIPLAISVHNEYVKGK